MKILVINSTGNVGKSFLAREVLYPLLPEEKALYEIEKFNKGNEKFLGKNVNYKLIEPDKLGDLVSELLVTENAVIDVGASSADKFLKLGKEHGIFDFADMVVVPTVLEAKQIADTGEVIKKLEEVTASDKIFIVFNRVSNELDSDKAIEDNEHYNTLKSSLAGSDVECDPEYRLKNYDVVDKISKLELSIADVLADKTDYMKEIEKIKNDENMPKEEKLKLVKDLYDKHLVQKRAKEMQKDFERLATRLAVFIK